MLPYPFWIGVLILNIAFFVALRGDADGPARRPVLMSLLVALVLVLFGTAIFVTDVPRGEVAFRHLGVADALSQVGVDPGIDAYFNWPGFFALLATMLAATGLDPVTVALWAPVVNVGLWLAAVGVATRYLTSDPRRRWLVLWLFCLGNWQDQDYLSPQAFGFFLYLVLIGLLVGPLGARSAPFPGFRRADLAEWWRGRAPADPRPGHRVGALVVTLLLIVVICASHQLTPFMMLVAITALTLSGRVWPTRLPLIAGIVLVLWLVYPASPYLVGHPPLEDAGLRAAITANVVDRVSGTPGHVLVVQLRVLLTVVLWALAAAGAVRDWRRGRLDIRVILLALSPLLIFPVQMYGGEMLIRVSLFALPFIALQACSILLPTDDGARPSSRGTGVLVVTCFLLAALTVTGRFGNAQYDVFADSEIAAIDAAERMAPPDSAIISAAHPTPWRDDAYLDHRYRTIEDLCEQDLTPSTCGPTVYDFARGNAEGAYLVLMSSAEASLVIQGDTSTRDFAELERWLRTQQGVQLAFRDAHARVYEVVAP
ncbi:glycosyltransferase [Arthrobacter crusticola]|uniref:Glycosyltransferase n=1 Tax=Arthrobacter crusticola TaxID=2547960 RepID=A0A4R5TXK3_9MICC|nr:glycosyltransferase [Arthrobacter crusticola]